ncbi:MAG: alpha-N-acetylglucosaminidase N-terminal domain-containing protein, partial [Clostridia bacterium]|nr:alpha-N-acetylglucosaminidase N-terminal domain-containing protein [Clostridia bacterium]
MIEKITPIYMFLQRIVPNHMDQIICEYIDADHGMDVYEIDSKDGKIVLRGNSNSSIALAFGQYLRNTAKV